ncbi:MAG: DoxX family membrane protein [Candidatus Aminicenantes bacterium]|nr:DoxX family membrane protein [Candidatus Aminicenantes bacterium]
MTFKSKISRILSSRYVRLICRLVLGGIFIYAGIGKIIQPLEFSKVVYSYRILPEILVNFAAVFLSWLEVTAGLFLIAGIFTRGAALVLTSLLAIFILALGINTLRGIGGGCGCFMITGLDSAQTPGQGAGILLFFRDITFLVPGIILLFSGSKERPLDPRE